MPAALKYEEAELIKRALAAQNAEPLLSEGAVCGRLKVGREYIANRAKKSEAIAELREDMAAIRQLHWELKGHALIALGPKDSNATVYIWMTRNTLGWRDQKQDDSEASKTVAPSVPMTPEQLVELVKSVRKK